MSRIHRVSLAVLASLIVSVCAAADPIVTKYHLGDVTGSVDKISAESITLKVPTVVQSGVTRKRVGGSRGRTISIPKYSTKQVDTTYQVGSEVEVKTLSGKSASMADVRTGETVRVYVYKVVERVPGEKATSHVEVRRIVVAKQTQSSQLK